MYLPRTERENIVIYSGLVNGLHHGPPLELDQGNLTYRPRIERERERKLSHLLEGWLRLFIIDPLLT